MEGGSGSQPPHDCEPALAAWFRQGGEPANLTSLNTARLPSLLLISAPWLQRPVQRLPSPFSAQGEWIQARNLSPRAGRSTCKDLRSSTS